MGKFDTRNILSIAARLGLGGLFLYAGVPKIFHPADFARIIHNYQILPDQLINLAALIMPWVETLLGAFLILGVWLPGAVTLINLLLIVFTAVTAFSYARGLNISCGCFSGGDGGIGIPTILRDLGFLFVSALLFVDTWGRRKNPKSF